MADAPDWPKVLSLAVHEFRTPLTVVSGYLRMLSSDRVGPLSEDQRRVIGEAERSCTKLAALLSELSEVAHHHQGRLTYLSGPVPVARLLEGLTPAAVGRDVQVDAGAADMTIDGDAARLSKAIVTVAVATAREMLTDEPLLVTHEIRPGGAGRELFLAFGGPELAHEILHAPEDRLTPFDTARGGIGLSLVVAQQVLEGHGARLYGGPGEHSRVGAALALPLSS